MIDDSFIKILVVINGGTLAAILTYGYKVIRFLNSLEFKTELLWEDYEYRQGLRKKFHEHSRVGDEQD